LVESIETILTDKVGSSQTVGFAPITDMLKDLARILSAQLVRRGVGEAEAQAGASATASAIGEIRSREDVVRILEKACDYFQRNEPSSPVPMLLRRAQRLLSKDFLEIVRDLAPSGVQEVEKLRGPEGG
jgi:type VI secretion system protein ImpA